MQRSSIKKRPRSANQLAEFLIDLCTGNPIVEDISPIADKAKNPATGRCDGFKSKAEAAQSKKKNSRK